jgi:hypothetical protein
MCVTPSPESTTTPVNKPAQGSEGFKYKIKSEKSKLAVVNIEQVSN